MSNEIAPVSPNPRRLRRVNSTEPRGLAKVCSLGAIFALPSPMVGKPGTATVPDGTLPPRREISNPKP